MKEATLGFFLVLMLLSNFSFAEDSSTELPVDKTVETVEDALVEFPEGVTVESQP